MVRDTSLPSFVAPPMSSRPQECRLLMYGIGHPPKAVTMGEMRGMREDAARQKLPFPAERGNRHTGKLFFSTGIGRVLGLGSPTRPWRCAWNATAHS